MLHRLFLALGLLGALGACQAGEALTGAFEGTLGDTYDYAALEVPLSVDSAASVAVTVIDQRPYVVNGDESPSFVGTVAGRYRNTVDVATESGRPLAELIARAITDALAREGISATAVAAEEESAAGLPPELAATAADRRLVVRIGEWRTDAVVRVGARWQLEAAVYDRAGEQIGRRMTQGAETIGTAGFDEETAELAVAALARHLGYLLNDPEIARALGDA